MDKLSLLQGIFPTQGSNPGLPYYRQILYKLSHQGSPETMRRSKLKVPDARQEPGTKKRKKEMCVCVASQKFLKVT